MIRFDDILRRRWLRWPLPQMMIAAADYYADTAADAAIIRHYAAAVSMLPYADTPLRR